MALLGVEKEFNYIPDIVAVYVERVLKCIRNVIRNSNKKFIKNFFDEPLLREINFNN
jgi:hypothetical protein